MAMYTHAAEMCFSKQLKRYLQFACEQVLE